MQPSELLSYSCGFCKGLFTSFDAFFGHVLGGHSCGLEGLRCPDGFEMASKTDDLLKLETLCYTQIKQGLLGEQPVRLLEAYCDVLAVCLKDPAASNEAADAVRLRLWARGLAPIFEILMEECVHILQEYIRTLVFLVYSKVARLRRQYLERPMFNATWTCNLAEISDVAVAAFCKDNDFEIWKAIRMHWHCKRSDIYPRDPKIYRSMAEFAPNGFQKIAHILSSRFPTLYGRISSLRKTYRRSE